MRMGWIQGTCAGGEKTREEGRKGEERKGRRELERIRSAVSKNSSACMVGAFISDNFFLYSSSSSSSSSPWERGAFIFTFFFKKMEKKRRPDENFRKKGQGTGEKSLPLVWEIYTRLKRHRWAQTARTGHRARPWFLSSCRWRADENGRGTAIQRGRRGDGGTHTTSFIRHHR